jgi:hypothetical protein
MISEMIQTRFFGVKNHYPIVRIAFLSLVIASFFTDLSVAQTIPGRGAEIKVFPDTINFGRVRLGRKRDSAFAIKNIGSANLELIDLIYKESLDTTEFNANTIKSSFSYLLLDTFQNTIVQDSVFFQPTKTGLHIDSIPIWWSNLIDTIDTPTVILLGTGIAPNVVSNGYNFGPLRVDSSSQPQTIFIINSGSDTTAVDTVTIVDSSEILDSDFTVSLDTLPANGGNHPVLLDYEGNPESWRYSYKFSGAVQSKVAGRRYFDYPHSHCR